MAAWWQQEPHTVLTALQTDLARGLAMDQAQQRLSQYGPNALEEERGRSPWDILVLQFTSLMVLLLIGAAVVSGVVLHEWEDAAVILVIVILNAALGFRQEYQAEQAMSALKKLAVPTVRVRREGEVDVVSAQILVPGDIVFLEAGDLVPADARLIEASNLRVQEATLTGEAEPVEKTAAAINKPDLALSDRRNMVHLGTVVTYGRGVAVVTTTGMRTELGHIATMIQQAEVEDTVLQKKLDRLSRMLVVVALLLIGVVTLEGWLLLGMQLRVIFMTAVSMAVAAIPEGLPAVVVIALALGAQRMLKRHSLIRRLPAVETLGSVTVICSDKTGTLTQNRMAVTEVDLPKREIDLPGVPHMRSERLRAEMDEDPSLGLLLVAGALCNDAVLKNRPDQDEPDILGDPTEGALVAAAAWVGWSKEQLQDWLPRANELPFDSERKRMTTVHALPDDARVLPPPLREAVEWVHSKRGAGLGFTKGAVGSVLEEADHIWVRGKVKPMSDSWRERIQHANETMAEDGIRVIGIALRAAPSLAERGETVERGLVYLGMVGMLDPLRSEVKPAVETCRAAGIRPIMITGDHPLIARNIATHLGFEHADRYQTGEDLTHLDHEGLERTVEEVSVYARVAPEHKMKIVDALQAHGHVVAMTGDGVNDAPALKQADIGVAMGITGTDVSKEASDMVLQDDNFATIVAAVEEGRAILDNIIRFVRYILASNCAEILVMLLAPLFRLPLPLLPVQILWMNLVTDGLPALALGVEPAQADVMARPPRDPKAPIIGWSMGLHILWVGALMALLGLGLGYAVYQPETALGAAAQGVTAVGQEATAHAGGIIRAAPWQTMVFTMLVFSQLALALAERSERRSLFAIGLFSNPYMAGAVALTFGLQMAVIYTPFLQPIFRTVPLTLGQLFACALLSSGVFAAVEIKKTLQRRSRIKKE